MRELCTEYGAVLIFDEVKTGFRLARGGAQEYFGIRADLAAYAKAMGNGFPVSAVAGRDEIMAMVEPGRVAHGGTYCGNVVAATAAAATLEILETQPVLETIAANGQVLMRGIDEILTRAGVPHVVSGVWRPCSACCWARTSRRWTTGRMPSLTPSCLGCWAAP